MKKVLIEEPEFIGGLGPMTKEEEAALSAYFAQKKTKARPSAKRAINRRIRKTAA